MGDENPWLLIFGGGALTTLLGAFIKGAWDYLRGRHKAEQDAAQHRRDTISTLKQEVRDAEREADQARADAVRSHTEMVQHQRRAAVFWEYANQLRQDAICHYQARPEDLRAWPTTD